MNKEDECWESSNATEGNQSALWAIAGGLYALAKAQQNTAFQIKYLGNGDASTPMGAIEAFGTHIGEKIDALTLAISSIDFDND